MTEPPDGGNIIFNVGSSSASFKAMIQGANLSYPATYSITVDWEIQYGAGSRLYQVWLSSSVLTLQTTTSNQAEVEVGGVINRNDMIEDATLILRIQYTPGTTAHSIQHGDLSARASIINYWEERSYNRSADIRSLTPQETAFAQFTTDALYNGSIDVYFQDNGTLADSGGIFNGSVVMILPNNEDYYVTYVLEYQGEQQTGEMFITLMGDSHYHLNPDVIVIEEPSIIDYTLWVYGGIGAVILVLVLVVFRSRKKKEPV